jgi:hypothetical protein
MVRVGIVEHVSARNIFDELDHRAGLTHSHGKLEEELVVDLIVRTERARQRLRSEVAEFAEEPAANTTPDHARNVMTAFQEHNP